MTTENTASRESRMDPQYLRDCLSYNALTGIFTWLVRPRSHFKTVRDCNAWNTKNAGKRAGRTRPDGRVDLSIDDAKWRAHRVAWAITEGRWPIGAIDHADGKNGNNARANLRECSLAQNQFNRRIARNNTTGFKGVAWLPKRQKFRAAIRIGGKQTHLGLFDTPEAAHAVYCNAARIHHGVFANTGASGHG